MAHFQASRARDDIFLMKVQEKLWQRQHKREGERISGEQAAAYGAAGVEMRGSPLRVMVETAGELERDAYLHSKQTEINISRKEQDISMILQGARDAATASALDIAGSGLDLFSGLYSSGAFDTPG